MLHNERGDLVTGDSNGTIYVWGNGGNTITNFIKHGHDVSGWLNELCSIVLKLVKATINCRLTMINKLKGFEDHSVGNLSGFS